MALPLGLEYSCECVKYPMRHFEENTVQLDAKSAGSTNAQMPFPLHRCNASSHARFRVLDMRLLRTLKLHLTLNKIYCLGLA
jgi:hypothetical protein